MVNLFGLLLESMHVRIIAGQFKKRKLHHLKTPGIRPTSDAVRESIFNILHHSIRNAIVLDLFCGTGAMAIESISRGASFAVLIDNSKQALALAAKNIQLCKIDNQTKLIKWDILTPLLCLNQKRFDIIFIDPPYKQNMAKTALMHIQQSSYLMNESIVIVEHYIDDSLSDVLGFELIDKKTYGKTVVSFFKPLKMSHS